MISFSESAPPLAATATSIKTSFFFPVFAMRLMAPTGTLKTDPALTIFFRPLSITYPCPRTIFHFSERQRSEEHTSELQSQFHFVCRLLLEKIHTAYSRPTVYFSRTYLHSTHFVQFSP